MKPDRIGPEYFKARIRASVDSSGTKIADLLKATLECLCPSCLKSNSYLQAGIIAFCKCQFWNFCYCVLRLTAANIPKLEDESFVRGVPRKFVVQTVRHTAMSVCCVTESCEYTQNKYLLCTGLFNLIYVILLFCTEILPPARLTFCPIQPQIASAATLPALVRHQSCCPVAGPSSVCIGGSEAHDSDVTFALPVLGLW